MGSRAAMAIELYAMSISEVVKKKVWWSTWCEK
jgi:hypothetical protein